MATRTLFTTLSSSEGVEGPTQPSSKLIFSERFRTGTIFENCVVSLSSICLQGIAGDDMTTYSVHIGPSSDHVMSFSSDLAGNAFIRGNGITIPSALINQHIRYPELPVIISNNIQEFQVQIYEHLLSDSETPNTLYTAALVMTISSENVREFGQRQNHQLLFDH